ncbi:MAG: TRAP transporter small permease [Rhodoplanes sp.]|uniref:TRAP transporter small permease n=1 Tax=Rhodoplanes sp. TaxID=1968906 RepID=UPI001824D2A5|nr:TRAP transporter small permease [Rhodoplanes sp.]NVO17738.1 TRAP transporter small permease [Rhodoplanes sp.]
MSHGLDAIETAGPPVPEEPRGVARMIGLVDRLVLPLCSLALVLASFVLTYSVVSRYILHSSTDWQDEMSVFLIIGAVFLSAASIQAQRGHVAIEAFTGFLPPAADRVRLVLVDLASLAFCGFFAWKSWTLLEEAIVEGYHSGSTWGPPLWIPYSLMAVGMTLLSLRIALQAGTGILRLRHGRPA